jgi:hypothetical protein
MILGNKGTYTVSEDKVQPKEFEFLVYNQFNNIYNLLSTGTLQYILLNNYMNYYINKQENGCYTLQNQIGEYLGIDSQSYIKIYKPNEVKKEELKLILWEVEYSKHLNQKVLENSKNQTNNLSNNDVKKETSNTTNVTSNTKDNFLYHNNKVIDIKKDGRFSKNDKFTLAKNVWGKIKVVAYGENFAVKVTKNSTNAHIQISKIFNITYRNE